MKLVYVLDKKAHDDAAPTWHFVIRRGYVDADDPQLLAMEARAARETAMLDAQGVMLEG